MNLRLQRTILAVIAASLAASPLSKAAAPPAWDPVTAPELAADYRPLDRDAPAEAIFRRITIDDRDYPAKRRVSEYVRYRILDPERAADVTRISQFTASVEGEALLGNSEINARLALPDGTLREFGGESVQERDLARGGAEQTWAQRLFGEEGAVVKEKFLAIGGIESGCVLEFRLSHVEYPPIGEIDALLQAHVPIRELALTHWFRQGSAYVYRPFLLNGGSNRALVRLTEEGRAISVSARDVQALVREPFSGATANYALTYLGGYTATHQRLLTHQWNNDTVRVDAESGPWALYATKVSLFEKDMSVPTSRVKKLAAQVTEGAASDADKARAIHSFVQDLHRRFLLSPRKRAAVVTQADLVDSLNQVLDFEKEPNRLIPPEYFVWLEVSLCRSAGLETQAVLLPNRRIGRFDPQMVAEMFLPMIGARILADGKWRFSFVLSPAPLPIDMLPWRAEGQVALIAQENRQEFVDVPQTQAAQSAIGNYGSFRLEADGSLVGNCRRTYTGQSALAVRDRTWRSNPERRQAFLRRVLAAEFKPALVRLTDLRGIDDPNAPIEVNYQMRWRNFAVLTRDRIIFRPSVFHAASASPFTASARRYPLDFPYPWTETDRIEIQLPAGCSLETTWTPPSLPGAILSYTCEVSRKPGGGAVELKRDFISKIVTAPASAYPELKSLYDLIAASDRHELVLTKAPGMPGPSEAKPAEPEQPESAP